MKNYIYKLFLLLILISGIKKLTGQNQIKYGFELQNYLKTIAPTKMVPLLVEGNESLLNEIVSQYGGHVRLQVDELFSVEIPAKFIPDFSKNEAVYLIEFSLNKGKSMSDTMLIQVNADSVLKRFNPLRSKYSGKGVLLGVIDSGIELAHPDFQDSTGRTRVLYVWDQGVAYDPNRQAENYTYGVEWDSAAINTGTSTHDDKAVEFGHGSNVAAAAASNGLAKGNFKGVAPKVNIISVATDFRKPNWLQTVAEAIDYIYTKADSLNMPCVINASVGTYLGSHDGLDIAARMIDKLIKEKEGRAFVCAAGNAGQFKFHLQHKPQNDTVFTWFTNTPSQHAGLGGIYFEAWSDTNDFKNVKFAIGMDREINGDYEFRGRTVFDSISNRLNVVFKDSVMSLSGNLLARIETYAEKSQGRYKLEVSIIDPDSSDYLFRLESAGEGKLDIWSSFSLFRHSNMVATNLPSQSNFPPISNYIKPDSLQTMVSSFTCLPSAITVGNYTNRNTYTDVTGTLRNMGVIPGAISPNSSLGPNRKGYTKPDLASAGDFMFGAGRLATIKSQILTSPFKVSEDSLHFRNGGTSMASPTVAGMVALYLEQCPKADYEQIKLDLLNTTKADLQATNLPNPKWGAGKANAFAFLKERVFTPSLNPILLKSICEGDSVKITSSNSYTSYLWNTADTSQEITVHETGDYFVFVEDINGCLSPSDTTSLVFNPNPTIPILQQTNDTLFVANQIGTYQWYLDEIPLMGQRDSALKVNQTGDYFCIFTNNFGCSISTDTINVVITGINENTFQEYHFFPNPTNGFVTVNLSQNSTINALQLYSLEGKLVWQIELQQKMQQLELNWGHINKGVYWLKLTDQNDKTFYEKVILQ